MGQKGKNCGSSGTDFERSNSSRAFGFREQVKEDSPDVYYALRHPNKAISGHLSRPQEQEKTLIEYLQNL